jgi:type III pantothenate kinase
MLLAVDAGNTNITLGLYVGETLRFHWRLTSVHDKTPDEYGSVLQGLLQRAKISASDIHAMAIASVVPPITSTFAEIGRRLFHCEALVVDGTSNTGVRILYDDLTQLGADRIVDVAAGYRLYGGPACIIDLGTATTFDAVSAEGEYLGGAIAPGIGIASQALFRRTSKLPKVDLRWPPSPIGKNIVHSLQSGLMFGYVGLIEGIVGRFREELGSETKIIATGGLAEIFTKETNVITVHAPWLTLDGLRIIYDLNTNRPRD